jgi:hypothetical protein
MNKQQVPQAQIDLTTTTPITSPDGNSIFQEGVILRKVSRFITGQAEDGVIPIPCFFDIKTGKVMSDFLPKELRVEYAELNETQD